MGEVVHSYNFSSFENVLKKVTFVPCCCLNVFLYNSYTEILTPNMMVLGVGAFGSLLGHEGVAS